MILQKMVFTTPMEKTNELYFQGEKVSVVDETLFIEKGGKVQLNTFYNLFSMKKWTKYTKVSSVIPAIECCGKCQINVFEYHNHDDKVKQKKIYSEILDSDARKVFELKEIALLGDAVLGLEIIALESTHIYSGYYKTDSDIVSREVQLGICICTFKREEFVERNMKAMTEGILKNPEALSYGHVQIIISDNAQSLQPEEIENDEIIIVKNRNLGGVGGFTRAMIEHLHGENNITHFLLMDDDATIDPEAVERTYRFLTVLKPEYYDYLMGGSLIRKDSSLIQYERGAVWNNGQLLINGCDINLGITENAVLSEWENFSDYAAWCYCCIPKEHITKNGLPLPIFIHMDDAEYGLRAEGKFMFLNGVCVWHDAYGCKMPGTMEYYDVRNPAIVNAIHRPDYTAKDFKVFLLKQVSRNVGKYRYQYIDMNLKAAVDFLRGFDWFYHLDTLKLQGELLKYNYQMDDAEKYLGYEGIEESDFDWYGVKVKEDPKWMKILKSLSVNGYFLPAKKQKIKVSRPDPPVFELFRYKEVLYVDANRKALHVKRSLWQFVGAYVKLFKVCRIIDKRYAQVCEEYREKYHLLTEETFWNDYLGL